MRLASGENAAVILVDTQGGFDPETELQQSTSIFSFSVLLSSVQVFNLKERLNVDDLSHLELFAKYGEFLARENKENATDGSKPFQDIVFLFRDWCNAESHPYGWEGGLEYLNKYEIFLSPVQSSIPRSFRGRTVYFRIISLSNIAESWILAMAMVSFNR